ncbi:MAG TPA: T9SS type A sorting domain-containing protein [Bacteroidia bacterium]|nr:T9SS type A sorting domain-containing protein [Bacteroidia bacterium]
MKRSKILLQLIICLCFSLVLTAQPAIQWQNSYGGTLGDGLSQGNAQHDQIEPTPDGGFIIGGYSYSNDGDVTGHHGLTSTLDCWVVKLDSLGSIEWQRSYGGSEDENIQCIKPTSNGGYIFSANTNSIDGDVTGFNGGIFDTWVVKLDSIGNIEWEQAVGGSSGDHGRSVCETYDGGFLLGTQTASNDSDVAGNHGGSDIWLVKFDAFGMMQWQKCIGGTANDGAYTVRETDDHGFVLAGETSSTDGDFIGNIGSPLGSAFILKTDSTGNVEWFNTFGGSSLDFGREVYPTADGGYILGASTASGDLPGANGSLDYYLVKVDSVGNLVWHNCYGGTQGEFFKSARPTSDGGFVLIGSAMSNDSDLTNNYGSGDVWILKLDAAGDIDWQRSYGGSENDDGTSIVQTSDGGFIVGAESHSNDFDVSGHHGALSEPDFWVMKLGSFTTKVSEPEDKALSLIVSPNPAQSSALITFTLKHSEFISLSLFDLQGRFISKLKDGILPSGNHSFEWNIDNDDNVPNGIYFVRFNNGDKEQNVKLVVCR